MTIKKESSSKNTAKDSVFKTENRGGERGGKTLRQMRISRYTRGSVKKLTKLERNI